MMNVKDGLKGQFRAGVLMMKECIELCPEDLWSSGVHPRTFWRIAYHGLFYTHFYMMPNCDSLTPWEKHCWHGRILWSDDEQGLPPDETTFTQGELAEYADHIFNNINEWIDALDLDSQESGFPWYPIPKIDHVLVNLRHLGVHIGQLQELLYAQGLEPDWIGKR